MARIDYYIPPNSIAWHGRTDVPPTPDTQRWHQVITLWDLNSTPDFTLPKKTPGIVLLGFASDEGVARNGGRIGACEGPAALRSALANLPVHFGDKICLVDAGDVACKDNNLESAQIALGHAVAKILTVGLTPIVLGGGHEMAFGHYLGLKSHLLGYKKSRFGIVNFDAHFDLRPYPNGATSGSPFFQIADDRKAAGRDFSYLCLGIQHATNTRHLFRTAESLRVKYVLARDMHLANLKKLKSIVTAFVRQQDFIYVTFCLDVLAAAFAPGVSAPSALGVLPDICCELLGHLVRSKKVLSFDVAELSPSFDQDGRTAKLAAALIFEVVNLLV